METFEITYHVYEGRGKKRTCKEIVKTYVRLSLEECKALEYGDSVSFLTRQGGIGTVKVNDTPKTWKTRKDVRVPLKYGLYEYSYTECNVDQDGTEYWHGEILVKEQENERN
jgi:hypothetical protein